MWKAGITPHYCANITGHGWRKLLRHAGTLHLPHPLRAAQDACAAPSSSSTPGTTTCEAYSTLNMGAGFALFVAASDAERTVAVAQAQGVGARVAGVVEAGPKQLVIEPLGLSFGDDALQLR